MAVAIVVLHLRVPERADPRGARVYWAMARDGLFFQGAGRLHPVYVPPVAGLVFQAVWAAFSV